MIRSFIFLIVLLHTERRIVKRGFYIRYVDGKWFNCLLEFPRGKKSECLNRYLDFPSVCLFVEKKQTKNIKVNLCQSASGSNRSSSFLRSSQVSCRGRTDPGPALAALRVQRETGYHGEGGRAGGPPLATRSTLCWSRCRQRAAVNHEPLNQLTSSPPNEAPPPRSACHFLPPTREESHGFHREVKHAVFPKEKRKID